LVVRRGLPDSQSTFKQVKTGISGVQIELYQADDLGEPTGDALATTTTDADGHYIFANLAAETTYALKKLPSPNLDAVGSRAGVEVKKGLAHPVETAVNDPLGRGSVNVSEPSGLVAQALHFLGLWQQEEVVDVNTIEGIALASGDQSVENNFGEVGVGSIGGVTFFDVDGDGIYNPNPILDADAEPESVPDVPLSDMEVVLYDDTDAEIATALTDADGMYSFDDLHFDLTTLDRDLKVAVLLTDPNLVSTHTAQVVQTQAVSDVIAQDASGYKVKLMALTPDDRSANFGFHIEIGCDNEQYAAAHFDECFYLFYPPYPGLIHDILAVSATGTAVLPIILITLLLIVLANFLYLLISGRILRERTLRKKVLKSSLHRRIQALHARIRSKH
jgi:hypothetical protein